MKRFLLVAVVLTLFASSCVQPADPTVSLSPDKVSVVPSVVEFKASGVLNSQGKNAALIGYQFRITDDEDGSSIMKFSEDGTLKYAFEKTGNYTVAVTVADSFGMDSDTPGGSSALSKVTILNPFDAFSWELDQKAIYQNDKYDLNASNISAYSYFWEVYKPLDDTTSSEDGFEETPYWKGEGVTCTTAKFSEIKSGYMIKLIVSDIFGNSEVYTDLFDVISPTTPRVVASVAKKLDDESVGDIVSDPTDPKMTYENLPLWLDSSLTLAGEEDSLPLTITKVTWYISKNSIFSEQISADSVGLLEWTPTSAGLYSLSLKVVNNIGVEAFLPIDIEFEVSKNLPVVASYNFTSEERFNGQIFEGQNAVLTVDASSPAAIGGKITNLLIDFDSKLVTDLNCDVSDQEGPALTVSFKTPYSESNENITYEGSIVVINEAGQKSSPIRFSVLVQDNNPVAMLELTPNPPVFYGSKITLSSEGSRTKDGDLTNYSCTMSLLNEAGNAVTLNNDGSFNFPAGVEATYTAKVVVQNINGVAEVSIPVNVIAPRLNATFNALLEPGCYDYFSGQTITLDASASRSRDLDPIRQQNYVWTVLFNGQDYVSGRTSSGFTNDRLTAHTVQGHFKLRLDLAGFYTISLKVSGNGTNWSDLFTQEISVINNIPDNIQITLVGKQEVTAAGVKMGRYNFKGTAVSPDGSVLSYKWFNNKVPVGNDAGDKVGDSATFDYRGGTQTIYLVVANQGGAGVSSTVAYTFEADDYLPPAPPIVSPVKEKVGDGFPEWSWLHEDPEDVAGYRVKIGNDPWTEIAGNSFRPLQALDAPENKETPITLYVCAKDADGNWSDSASCVVIIDKLPPKSPVVTVNFINNTTSNVTPTFTWAPAVGSEAVAGYRYQLNSQSNAGWIETTEQEATIADELESGGHTLYLQAKDEVGNYSASTVYNFTVDVVPPALPVVNCDNSYVDGFTNSPKPRWVYRAGDKDDTVKFRHQLISSDGASEWTEIDANPSKTDYEFIPSVNLTKEDEYTLFVQARDAAGNWSDSAMAAITLDLTPPLSPNVSGVTPTREADITFNWVSSDSPYKFRYRMSTGSNWTTLSSSAESKYTLTGANEGQHTLLVCACDKAGNWSEPTSYTIEIDRTPPDPPTIFPIPFIFPRESITFSWEAAAGHASNMPVMYAYSYDSATWNPDSSGMDQSWQTTVESVADIRATNGIRRFYVRAKDEAGNWSNAAMTEFAYGPLAGDYPAPAIPYDSNPATADISSGYSPTIKIEGKVATGLSFRLAYIGGVNTRICKIFQNACRVYVTDSLGVESSVTTGVEVSPPSAPTVPNGNFEDSANLATGWNLWARGFQVVQLSQEWLDPKEGQTCVGDATEVWASVVNCTEWPEGSPGSFRVNHPTEGSSNVLASMGSAFIKTDGILGGKKVYIVRIHMTATSSPIAVFKDVTYRMRVRYYGENRDNTSWGINIWAEGENGLPLSSPQSPSRDDGTKGSWIEIMHTFTPNADGNVVLKLERTDIAGGARDAGGSMLDDVRLEVINYPTN